MAKTNATAREVLIFYLRPGETAPTRPTNLFLALCESDPGETGDMSTAEIAAGRLATPRVAIAFDDPTTTDPPTTQNTSLVSHGPFLQTCTISHWAVCRSNTRGTNDAIYKGARTGGGVVMAVDETLNTAAGALVVTED